MERVVDVPALMDRLEGDRELLKELIALYLEDEPALLEEIARAVQQHDAEALRRAAHTLKGSVANFCAPAAQDAALALETAGRDRSLGSAAELLENLQQQLVAVREELQTLADES
jgi:HPt (histidine-containing phosphotransfer) domain-containing protein